MPKIRGIHPDIWTDEDFVELSPFARLLWVGMWNYACDNGHLADRSKQIKMRVLPTDEVNVAELLRELEGNRRIVRSNGWITIPNFAKRQRPDKRYWMKCDAPGCTKPGDPERETRGGNVGPTPSPTRATTRPLVDGDGEVKVKGSDGDRKRAPRATQLPDEWQPNEQHHTFATENRLTLKAEVDQFRDHHRAKGTAMKDWDAAFRTWMRNAVKWRRDTPPLAVVDDPSKLPPIEESWMRRRPQ